MIEEFFNDCMKLIKLSINMIEEFFNDYMILIKLSIKMIENFFNNWRLNEDSVIDEFFNHVDW